MIINRLSDANPIVFQQHKEFFDIENAFIKYEGFNIAGSIKLKTARYLVKGLEEEHGISPSTHTLIESSSGNLGIALSVICKLKKYSFICVTDPNTLPISETYMRAYGAQIIKVTARDEAGGFLNKRIELINSMLKQDKNLIWTNQYASKYNPLAHYNTTAKEIFCQFPKLDYLFIGVGTTGTLVGCAKFFKEHSPKTKIIAVDNKGSVTFGFPASPRFIPGLGTSRKPEICSIENIAEIILVPEEETAIMCNHLRRKHGLFLGGSSGTVMYAARNYINTLSNKDIFLVVISPDFGDKYFTTVYSEEWVKEKFGDEIAKRAFYE